MKQNYKMNATTVFNFPASNSVNLMVDSIFDNTHFCQELVETCVGAVPESSLLKHPLVEKEDDCRMLKKRRANCVPGSRFPCKARGMPDDHNNDQAYFEIPANATHGKILACSHPACVASGRRFRYCAVCALPVAKRNFMKRHAHGIFSTSKELMDADTNEDYPICSFIGDTETDQVLFNSSVQGIRATCESKSHRRVVSSDTKASKESKNRIASPEMSPKAATQLNTNELKWISLLHDRPHTADAASMSRWMETVIMLSEDVAPPDTASTPFSSVAIVSPQVSSITAVSPIIQKFTLNEETGYQAPPLSQRGHTVDSDLCLDDIDFDPIPVTFVSPQVSSILAVSPIIQKFTLAEQTGYPAPPLSHSALPQRGHTDDSDFRLDDFEFDQIFEF